MDSHSRATLATSPEDAQPLVRFLATPFQSGRLVVQDPVHAGQGVGTRQEGVAADHAEVPEARISVSEDRLRWRARGAASVDTHTATTETRSGSPQLLIYKSAPTL